MGTLKWTKHIRLGGCGKSMSARPVVMDLERKRSQ